MRNKTDYLAKGRREATKGGGIMVRNHQRPISASKSRRTSFFTGCAILSLLVIVEITALPAQAIPITDPSGWFEFKGSVNYPIGGTTAVDVYASYTIATKIENGQTVVDYDKSTITFTQNTGLPNWNGYTTNPIKITNVVFVNDTSGEISKITFSSPKFDPQVPNNFTDNGIAGSIDLLNKKGEISDSYLYDNNIKKVIHTTKVSDVLNKHFDDNTKQPEVKKGKSVKNNDKSNPLATVPEPSTMLLMLFPAIALTIWATLKRVWLFRNDG